MIPRDYQKAAVAAARDRLATHGNTLLVLPTGAGKTICLSGTAGEFLQHPDAKACILAHRDELTAQNLAKFGRVNPHVSTSVFDAHPFTVVSLDYIKSDRRREAFQRFIEKKKLRVQHQGAANGQHLLLAAR